MKHLGNFLGKMAELIIVFSAVFVAPAVTISLIWMRLDVYQTCVTSPAYCAFMSMISGISIWYYTDWRAARSKTK